MIVLNVSSVAAVWFGGARVGAGEMQIGTMIAFLTYLIQILTAVMMATFVAVMWPRAAVCATRICEMLDTAPTVTAPESPVTEMPVRATFEIRDVSFGYPGAEEPVLTQHHVQRHRRPDAGRGGQHRCGQVDAPARWARAFTTRREARYA